MGWFANILLVIGVCLVGSKQRLAFLFTLAGELIWVGISFDRGQPDMLVICCVFAVMAVVNWCRWKKQDERQHRPTPRSS